MRNKILLPFSGFRNRINAIMTDQSICGYYWATTTNMLHANLMNFGVDYISPSAGSYRRY
jgi:hypothetical protein